MFCIKEKPQAIKVTELTELRPEEAEEDNFDAINKSKILWIRGITRIQQQVSISKTFKIHID